jgi:K+ transporter
VTKKVVGVFVRFSCAASAALLALVNAVKDRPAPETPAAADMFRRGLFYGDGVITPAISVLSAVRVWKSSRRLNNM